MMIASFLVPLSCEGVCDCIPDDRRIIECRPDTIIITGATQRRKTVINCIPVFGEYYIKH